MVNLFTRFIIPKYDAKPRLKKNKYLNKVSIKNGITGSFLNISINFLSTIMNLVSSLKPCLAKNLLLEIIFIIERKIVIISNMIKRLDVRWK